MYVCVLCIILYYIVLCYIPVCYIISYYFEIYYILYYIVLTIYTCVYMYIIYIYIYYICICVHAARLKLGLRHSYCHVLCQMNNGMVRGQVQFPDGNSGVFV